MIGVVDGESQRQRMDRFAPVDRGAARGLRAPRGGCRSRHRAPADRPLHVEQPRFRLAAGQVDGDRAQPHVGHVLGLADAGADGLLGLLEIDDVAAAHAAALLPAEAEHPQRAVAFGAADQAGDLGGADIEHAERPGAHDGADASAPPARSSAGGRTRRGMSFIVVLPHVGFLAAAGRRAAVGVAAGGSRVAVRRAAGAAPAGRAAACRWPPAGGPAARGPAASCISRSSAATSCTFRQHHVDAVVHVQVPAPLADAHRGDDRFCKRGPLGQRIQQRRGGGRRAGADDQRQMVELRDILVRQRSGRRDRSARIFPGSARSRTAGVPAGRRRPCRAGGARPSRARPRRAFRSARAPARREKPRIGSPLLDADGGAQQRLRRVGAAFDHDIRARAGRRGGRRPQPLAQRGERAARRCGMRNEQRRSAARRATPNATQPAGRSSRRWRRSSSFHRAGPVVD